MNKKLKVSAFILVLLLLGLSFAQDEGLYAPAPPADAAFVRVVHAIEGADAVSPTIGAATYAELAFAQSSLYRVVLQGEASLQAGAISHDFTVEAGKFYTVALVSNSGEASVFVLNDEANTNRAKALLVLYNLSDIASVDLKTADGSTPIVVGVAPNSEASIEVNGITVDLAVFNADASLESFAGVKLERGAAYSAIVMGTADDTTVIWVQSATTTE